jgi:VWFA-related protein
MQTLSGFEFRRCAFALLLFISISIAVLAQSDQDQHPVIATVPAQVPEPTLSTTVSEVLLDVVVRDKKAHIIRDLRPAEVQVFEDGVPQKLRQFQFFDGHSTPQTLAAATPAPSTTTPASASTAPRDVNELRDISIVSVVIAHLDMDPRGRKLALDVMRKFVKDELQPNTYVGVFRLGYGELLIVQPYTNDAETISNGVERAVRATSPTPALAGKGLSASDPAKGAAALIGQLQGLGLVNEMQDVYQDSMNYLSPLEGLVCSQAQIPGRKVVLLFSAGLPVHADTRELLTTVISRANRSNVSIYAVDTRGYTQQPDLANSRRLLTQAAQESMNQQLGTVNGGNQTVSPSEMMATEIAESSIHANTRGNLAELAEGTGGALLPDSLDLREPLRRAMEDVRMHYELSYSPSNLVTDGSFRKIEVRVSRPGATVFARSGYYALPMLNGRQIYPFEMATLKALNTKPLLHQFGFHAAALQFGSGPEQTQMTFVFQSPLRDLTISKDKQWLKVHVCVTALIKNDQGQVVQKISKDIPYELPAAKAAELQRAVVSFTTPFLLTPGRYTLETAALDRESMKASVNRSVLIVEPASPFSMSDVAMVRRVDSIEGPASSRDPLQARGAKVTPELSDVISREAGGQLTFYAVAYPGAPVDAPVEVNLEIWRDGQIVFRTPASQVPPEASGAASILASVPVEHFPAGQYQAWVSFQYKGQKATKMTTFTLATGS